MDPLSIIAAVATVASLVDMGGRLCISLHDMAQTFSSAPEAMSLMNRDISSLVSVLRQLRTALEDGNSSGLYMSLEARTDLRNILESCRMVLTSLETILDKFTHYPSGVEGKSVMVTKIKAIKLRFRWMIEEREVDSIRKDLDTHVQTLQLTLNAATALVVALIKSDTTHIVPLLEDVRLTLKRTVSLTSGTVIRTHNQSPHPLGIHNRSTKSTTLPAIEAHTPPAVIVEQTAHTELRTAYSSTDYKSTSIPMAEPNSSRSGHVPPPTLHHASSSMLTVSNRERSPAKGSCRGSPKRHLPVMTVPGKTLFLAARAGNRNIFLRILQSGAMITEVESDGTTVLQAAAEEGQLDVVLALLYYRADPDLGGGRTYSPLIAATDRQHAQVVAALLDARADPSAVQPEAPSMLKSAFHSAVYGQNSEILSMLLSADADRNTIPDLLNYACSYGTLDSVERLLETGQDINWVSKNLSYFGTPLQISVYNERIDLVKFLLDRKADPNISFLDAAHHQRSPLVTAVFRGNSKILSILLDAGADPNTIPDLLNYACSYGTLDSVERLLETGQDINWVSKNLSYFGTPLQISVYNERIDLVKFLLDRKADPNISFPDAAHHQRSPLVTAVFRGNSKILSILLDAGADPNTIPDLLNYACSYGTLDSVERLLETGQDINWVSKNLSYFGTPLQISVYNERIDLVKFLLDRKADPNISFPDAAHHQRSPLVTAVFRGNTKILSILLDAGADPNTIPGLLPKAAEKNDQLVKVLVEEGNVDPDSVDDALGTAMQVFAAKGQRDAMAYLLDLGADPNIAGGKYGSVLNAAIANGHEDCVDELGKRSMESGQSD